MTVSKNMNVVDITEIELGPNVEETIQEILHDMWRSGVKKVDVIYCTYEQKMGIAGVPFSCVRYIDADETPWSKAEHDFLTYESQFWNHIVVCPLDFALIDWAVNGGKGERPKMIYYNGSYKLSL
jgi:hypothetical protein